MILCVFRTAYISSCFILAAASDLLVITPPRLVVEYGGPASANCSTNITNEGMGWEATTGGVDLVTGVKLVTWKVSNLTDWNLRVTCFMNENSDSQPEKRLNVTIYKTPDNVSASVVGLTGPMMEGKLYELKCDIQNVAPVQNLIVYWYKGKTELKRENSTEISATPKNMLSSLNISASSSDHGAQYWCVAQLELGKEGPHSPIRVSSRPLNMNVHYSPKFSSNKETLDQPEKDTVINCTASANPLPTYAWELPFDKKKDGAALSLRAWSSGTYTCTAKNQYGSAVKQFTIIPKNRDNTTFWAILGVGLAVAGLLIAGYIIKVFFFKAPSNSVV